MALRNSHKQVESLWADIRDHSNKGHLVVSIYYKPPDEETADKALLLQLQEAACSQALILTGDFNYPVICPQLLAT